MIAPRIAKVDWSTCFLSRRKWSGSVRSNTLSTKQRWMISIIILFTWSPIKKNHNITSRSPELNKAEFGKINFWVQPLSYDETLGHTPAQNFHYLKLTEIRQRMLSALLRWLQALPGLRSEPHYRGSNIVKIKGYQGLPNRLDTEKIILRKMAHWSITSLIVLP